MSLLSMSSFNKLALISLLLTLLIQLSGSSPPIDYFLYTSQLRPPSVGAKELHLQPLDEIYNVNNAPAGLSQALVNRTIALIKNSSHTHDNDLIDMDVTQFAWHLMELQGVEYMKNRVAASRPLIRDLLQESQVSSDCQQSIESWLDKLTRLDKWATLMWNSWGNFPPSGVFEGTFTDLGSYRGCMAIEDNELIGQAQYCTIDYQPLIPTRPRFHSIYKKILDVDPTTNELINGDYAGSQWKVSSKMSSHGFSSERFKSRLPESGGAASQSNRYNKRTIVHNAIDSIASESNLTTTTTINNNLTLKAEVSSTKKRLNSGA